MNGVGAPKSCGVCGVQADTLDLYAGPRCATHPPRFEPRRAVALMVAGWPGTALAYVRRWEP